MLDRLDGRARGDAPKDGYRKKIAVATPDMGHGLPAVCRDAVFHPMLPRLEAQRPRAWLGSRQALRLSACRGRTNPFGCVFGKSNHLQRASALFQSPDIAA